MLNSSSSLLHFVLFFFLLLSDRWGTLSLKIPKNVFNDHVALKWWLLIGRHMSAYMHKATYFYVLGFGVVEILRFPFTVNSQTITFAFFAQVYILCVSVITFITTRGGRKVYLKRSFLLLKFTFENKLSTLKILGVLDSRLV